MTMIQPSSQTAAAIEQLLDAVAERARQADLFGPVTRRPGMVECAAKLCPEDAAFRIALEDGDLYVSWVTPDRYMSQSIEADLMWTGDDLADMIDEELSDQGWSGDRLGPLEHFRSAEKQFTFRSKLPLSVARLDPPRHAETAVQALLGYEAAFGVVGDMMG
jgi:hypothetical protein